VLLSSTVSKALHHFVTINDGAKNFDAKSSSENKKAEGFHYATFRI